MAEVWSLWPQAMSETLEFETDVRMARSAEWRDSLKDATQFLTFNYVLSSRVAEALINRVRLNALGEWLVPEWPNATISATTLAEDLATIPVSVSAAYQVGQQVIVGLDENNWEQSEVISTDVGSITIAPGLSRAYVGTPNKPVAVVPMALCISPNGLGFNSVYPVQGVSVQFMSIAPVDVSANPYQTFMGLPLVTDGRVPFQPLNGDVNQASDLFASGFGAYALQLVETFPRRRGVVSWYDKGAEERWARRQFLHFIRGKDGAFWLPTGQNDLPLRSSVASSSLTISVKPLLSDAAMLGKTILLSEGSNAVARTVTSALTIGESQLLETGAPGVAFTQAATVSFMTKSRLDTDQVDIGYQFSAGGIASLCTAPTIEVP